MKKDVVNKQRLDIATFERGLAHSREKARGMIMAGDVLVNGQVVDKPGTRVGDTDTIDLLKKPRYVSRGGEKLHGALKDFSFDPTDMNCADVGASTGGFTDCLLQHGAKSVYAIDVGYGQIAYTLRQDERVVVMERTNARHLEKLPVQPDLIVIDASFISLRLLLPVVKQWMHQRSCVISLVKPQFEAGKQEVGKGGVVRNHSVHRKVLTEIGTFASSLGFYILGVTRSKLKGPAGNIEYFFHLSLNESNQLSDFTIKQSIEHLTTE